MKVGTKVWTLSIFLLSVLVLVAGIGLWNANLLSKSLREQSQVHVPAARQMGTLDMNHEGLRGNVHSSFVAAEDGSEQDRNTVKKERDEIASKMREEIKSIEGLELSDSTRSLVEPIKPKVEEYLLASREVTDLALAGLVRDAKGKLPEFEKRFKELEVVLEKLSQSIEDESRVAAEKSEKQRAFSDIFVWIALVAGLSGGLMACYFFVRSLNKSLEELTKKLSDNSHKVDNAATDLSVSSQQLSAAATSQASSLQETAACLDEITAMVNKTDDNSKQLQSTSEKTSESAAKGKNSVQTMLEAMDGIQSSQSDLIREVNENNQKVAAIVKLIGEIENKTKVINDIVFQTKLLSFNASVEAARAGEHGKGFAVVAEEVGNLAQMSGAAAKEISEMLSNSTQKVTTIVSESKLAVDRLVQVGKQKLEQGKTVSHQCGASLQEIVDQVEAQSHLIQEISTALKEQSHGIQEISKAVQMLDQTTHESSAIASSTADQSSGLSSNSQNLLAVVDELNRIVIGEKIRASRGAEVVEFSGKKSERKAA